MCHPKDFVVKQVMVKMGGLGWWFGLAIFIEIATPYRDPNDPNKAQPKKAPMENKYT